MTDPIIGTLDLASLSLYLFWLFFAGLIYYLQTENMREGYPLEDEEGRPNAFPSLFPLPEPKTFKLPHGRGEVTVPGKSNERTGLALRRTAVQDGFPMEPTGDPMRDGVGPASYAQRQDVPEYTFEGLPTIVPMRVAVDAFVDPSDPDPRGLNVVGCDNKVAGTVHELWVDRSEPQIRYLEVAVAGGDRHVLVPITLAKIVPHRRRVEVVSVLASQFADAPVLSNPDQVTKLEEDRITAYFASGHLYATRARSEPLL